MSTATTGARAMDGTIRRLFTEGSLAGMGDAELLARFADRRDEAAFEAIVRRHGPMVLATCRAVLRDEHDADDAWQSTFLILARRAGRSGRRRLARPLALHGRPPGRRPIDRRRRPPPGPRASGRRLDRRRRRAIRRGRRPPGRGPSRDRSPPRPAPAAGRPLSPRRPDPRRGRGRDRPRRGDRPPPAGRGEGPAPVAARPGRRRAGLGAAGAAPARSGLRGRGRPSGRVDRPPRLVRRDGRRPRGGCRAARPARGLGLVAARRDRGGRCPRRLLRPARRPGLRGLADGHRARTPTPSGRRRPPGRPAPRAGR